jgi:hypothetical protein
MSSPSSAGSMKHHVLVEAEDVFSEGDIDWHLLRITEHAIKTVGIAFNRYFCFVVEVVTVVLFTFAMSTPKCFAEIKKSGVDGRGLFATKSLKAGELIFQKTRPLVTALDFTRQDDTCSNCFRSKLSELAVSSHGSVDASFGAKKCTGCRMVSYCSKVYTFVITNEHTANVSQVCQTQHWKRCHKHICKILKEALINIPFFKENPHTISNVTFALVEMIETRRQLTLSERDWISVLQLKSHATEMKAKDPGKFQEAEQIAERALIHLGNPPDYSQDFTTQLACAILTNSLTLVAPTCDPLVSPTHMWSWMVQNYRSAR